MNVRQLCNERADGNWTNAFDGLHHFNLAGVMSTLLDVLCDQPIKRFDLCFEAF